MDNKELSSDNNKNSVKLKSFYKIIKKSGKKRVIGIGLVICLIIYLSFLGLSGCNRKSSISTTPSILSTSIQLDVDNSVAYVKTLTESNEYVLVIIDMKDNYIFGYNEADFSSDKNIKELVSSFNITTKDMSNLSFNDIISKLNENNKLYQISDKIIANANKKLTEHKLENGAEAEIKNELLGRAKHLTTQGNYEIKDKYAIKKD